MEISIFLLIFVRLMILFSYSKFRAGTKLLVFNLFFNIIMSRRNLFLAVLWLRSYMGLVSEGGAKEERRKGGGAFDFFRARVLLILAFYGWMIFGRGKVGF